MTSEWLLVSKFTAIKSVENDVNTILQIEHNKRDVYNKSINNALKYLDNIVNPDSDIESSEDEDDL